MKRFIILFIIFFSITSAAISQSGWVKIFNNDYYSFSKIVKADSSNYFAFTYGLQYLKSTNGGEDWDTYNGFDTAYSFYDGVFTNSQTGWIAGENWNISCGELFKTTNGGLNWLQQNMAFPSYSYFSVYFLNQQTGWLASGSTVGRLLKTTNGGQNWSIQDFPGTYQISDVKYFDVNNGWILGNNFIAKTSNGGLNWINKNINNFPYQNPIYCSLTPVSINECWAVVIAGYPDSYSLFYRTTNGGDSWNLVYTYMVDDSFRKLYIVNETTDYAIGGQSFLLKSTNNGANWFNLMTGFNIRTDDLLFVDINNFFIGGANGYAPFNIILKTTNAGSN